MDCVDARSRGYGIALQSGGGSGQEAVTYAYLNPEGRDSGLSEMKWSSHHCSALMVMALFLVRGNDSYAPLGLLR